MGLHPISHAMCDSFQKRPLSSLLCGARSSLSFFLLCWKVVGVAFLLLALALALRWVLRYRRLIFCKGLQTSSQSPPISGLLAQRGAVLLLQCLNEHRDNRAADAPGSQRDIHRTWDTVVGSCHRPAWLGSNSLPVHPRDGLTSCLSWYVRYTGLLP